jgi:hypothetical protein
MLNAWMLADLAATSTAASETSSVGVPSVCACYCSRRERGKGHCGGLTMLSRIDPWYGVSSYATSASVDRYWCTSSDDSGTPLVRISPEVMS